jgi:hypothetical protein
MMAASLTVRTKVHAKTPPAGFRGALVCVAPAWRSVCRDLGSGGAGAGFADDGFAAGVGGDEDLDGEVADGPGRPRPVAWIKAVASSVNSGPDRPASCRWRAM